MTSLEGSDTGDRWRAAQALGAADPGRERLAALSAVLSSADPILLWKAAQALAQIRTPAAQEALLDAVATGNPGARAAAIDALGTIASQSRYLGRLAGCAREPQRIGASERSRSLSPVGGPATSEGAPSPGPETAAALLDLLQSDDAPLVRRAATLALGHLGDPVARDVLEASQADGRGESTRAQSRR